MTIEELLASPGWTHDVYIFCKTFDILALLLARRLRAAGKAIGQDLFDDYFSQTSDPRLERFRTWLRDMAPVTDFALCSTPRMARVVEPYLPGIPITSIDDPGVGYDPLTVAALANAKIARARERRTIDICWFGIGDNPFFPVGIADLLAAESEIAAIEQAGWQVTLKIVTNRRPFDAGGLQILRQLGIRYELVEWSEQAETEALRNATVVILPVGGQPFSRAKSLNRAVTAVIHGCQLLSLGYSLYDRLGDYVYRSTEHLLRDVESGDCLVRGETVPSLAAKLAELANPFEAASAFVAAAGRALAEHAAGRLPPPLLCLVHGRRSILAAHEIAATLGLSIATPFTEDPWNFPVRFDQVNRLIRMRVTPLLARRHGLPLVDDAPVRIRDLDFVTVATERLGVAPMPAFLANAAPLTWQLSLYDDVVRHIAQCCEAAFGAIDLIVSETSAVQPARTFDRLVG